MFFQRIENIAREATLSFVFSGCEPALKPACIDFFLAKHFKNTCHNRFLFTEVTGNRSDIFSCIQYTLYVFKFAVRGCSEIERHFLAR